MVSGEFSGVNGVPVVSIAKNLFQRHAPFEVYNKVKAKGITIGVLVNNDGQGQYSLGSMLDTQGDGTNGSVEIKTCRNYPKNL